MEGDDGDFISGHHVPSTSSRGGSGGILRNSGEGSGNSWSATHLADSAAATMAGSRYSATTTTERRGYETIQREHYSAWRISGRWAYR